MKVIGSDLNLTDWKDYLQIIYDIALDCSTEQQFNGVFEGLNAFTPTSNPNALESANRILGIAERVYLKNRLTQEREQGNLAAT